MNSLPCLNSAPDEVYFHLDEASAEAARPLNPDRWEHRGTLLVLSAAGAGRTSISIQSRLPVRQILLRWNRTFPSGTRLLGDAWERTYGDAAWLPPHPDRLMPWYFLASTGTATRGYGVLTGASAIACWQTDPRGISLSLDVRAGGEGVSLGERVLHAATLAEFEAAQGDSPYRALRSFCAELCPHHLTPSEPVVGHNDWYWLYGKNSEQLILESTRRFMELYPADAGVRPWSVIDDGWQTPAVPPKPHCNGGPWEAANPGFPDMAGLAEKIKRLGARPGIWMRPLQTKTNVPDGWKIRCPKPNSSEGGWSLDPTVPEVRELVFRDIRRLREWGYEMIKHDFSTYDITGRWGFEMNGGPMGFAPDGWSFADTTRTTAEIIAALYQTIREAAGGEVRLIGCNTVAHLAAGLVEIQRIGDDTSATDWDRTRKMGVNTLAFRSAHQGVFYAADADCVPVSPHVPEHLTGQWLDLVARSGTPLFLSIDPAALTPSAEASIRQALIAAVAPCAPAEPLDWWDTTIPSRWILQGVEQSYDW